MIRKGKGISKIVMVVLIAAVAVATLGVYSALTYPRIIVSFPVSFAIGADIERREFSVPILHEWIRVEVDVKSGTLLWTAKIVGKDEILWSHSAHQGDQTTYNSNWKKVSSGNYNFTFTTAGIGSLEAEIKITSKGGLW